ncbi:hypothetical protein QQ045_016296 [Rhodiola kirilowii]
MKQLIRRLSRVADSSRYSLLTSTTVNANSFRRNKLASRRSINGVPEGHLPMYVGDEMERFVVSADLLNHPIFVRLLNKSAQEYGYEQQGVLRIPCQVLVFERLLEAVRIGSRDLLDSLADELL